MIDHTGLSVAEVARSKVFYRSNRYGAFALDPDGNKVETVCHAPA